MAESHYTLPIGKITLRNSEVLGDFMKKILFITVILSMMFLSVYAETDERSEINYLQTEINKNLNEIYNQLRYNPNFNKNVYLLRYTNDNLMEIIKTIENDNVTNPQTQIVIIDNVYIEGEIFFGSTNSTHNKAKESYYEKERQAIDNFRKTLGDRFIGYQAETPYEIPVNNCMKYAAKGKLRIKIDKNSERVVFFDSVIYGEDMFGSTASNLNKAVQSLYDNIEKNVAANRELGKNSFGFAYFEEPVNVSERQNHYRANVKFIYIVNKSSAIDKVNHSIKGEKFVGTLSNSINRAYNSLMEQYYVVVERAKKYGDAIFVGMDNYSNADSGNYSEYGANVTLIREIK